LRRCGGPGHGRRLPGRVSGRAGHAAVSGRGDRSPAHRRGSGEAGGVPGRAGRAGSVVRRTARVTGERGTGLGGVARPALARLDGRDVRAAGPRPLVLSQLAALSYTRIATLTAGHVTVHDGTAAISTPAGTATLLRAADDPMLCGGCAVSRWLRVLDLAVTGPSPWVLARAVQAAQPVTDRSPHPCRSTRSPTEATRSAPLLPPIDQCGYLPFPLQPLSPHSLSRRVRDLLEGDLGAHRDLPVDADEEPAGPRRRAARSPCRGVARTAEPTGRQPCTGGTPTTLRWPVSRMY